MDCDSEGAFGTILPDDVTIQLRANFAWLGETLEKGLLGGVSGGFPVENVGAKGDAVVTDVDSGAGNEFFNLGVALAAEGAKGEVGRAGHGGSGTYFEGWESLRKLTT
jgi:hypothetical protein